MGTKQMTWQWTGRRARAVRVQDVELMQRDTQGKHHALLQVNTLLVLPTFQTPQTVFPSASFCISCTSFVWFVRPMRGVDTMRRLHGACDRLGNSVMVTR